MPRTPLSESARSIKAAYDRRFGPIRVLFVVRSWVGLAHQALLIGALAARRDFEVSITLEPSGIIGREQFDRYRPHEAARIIDVATARQGAWDYVFYAEVSAVRLDKPNTGVLLTHGNAWGNGYTTRRPEGFDDRGSFLAHQPYVSLCQVRSVGELRRFQTLFPDRAASERFRPVVLGNFKFDHYARRDAFERAARLASLGLSSDRPTIVVTTHWLPEALLLVLGFPVVEALLRHDSAPNVIVLGHERLWNMARSGATPKAAGVWRALHDALPRHDRLRFFPELVDNCDMLSLADLFVCDNSSVFVECLFFDRPLLLFKPMGFEYSDPDVYALYAGAAHVFADFDGLGGLVTRALRDPSALGPMRERALDAFASRRGTAVSFTVQLLRRLGRLRGPDSQGWRRACRIIDAENRSVTAANEADADPAATA
jgi:hypothetical protein